MTIRQWDRANLSLDFFVFRVFRAIGSRFRVVLSPVHRADPMQTLPIRLTSGPLRQ
jgi:hypothetical protein